VRSFVIHVYCKVFPRVIAQNEFQQIKLNVTAFLIRKMTNEF